MSSTVDPIKVFRNRFDHLPAHNLYARVNKKIAITITRAVGSMTCAYAFALLALASLPAILTQAFTLHFFPHWMITASLITLVAWVSSYFLQLVLLPVIQMGTNILGEASDARAIKTFDDTEEILDRLNLDTQGGLQVLSEKLDAISATLDKSG
jgi:hypothetical protein